MANFVGSLAVPYLRSIKAKRMVQLYVGKSISKLQMDIELKQTRALIGKVLSYHNIISLYIEALIPSFHKRLKTSNIDTIQKDTQTLIDASKEVGLEVNAEKTKYMLLSRHQNAGQDLYIKRGNRCFENVAHFRYLGTTIINQNLIQEEIKEEIELR
jgi:23S rRNA U2552 (ribose-2'-O)-methylase RlmE/FtsJ